MTSSLHVHTTPCAAVSLKPFGALRTSSRVTAGSLLLPQRRWPLEVHHFLQGLLNSVDVQVSAGELEARCCQLLGVGSPAILCQAMGGAYGEMWLRPTPAGGVPLATAARRKEPGLVLVEVFDLCSRVTLSSYEAILIVTWASQYESGSGMVGPQCCRHCVQRGA